MLIIRWLLFPCKMTYESAETAGCCRLKMGVGCGLNRTVYHLIFFYFDINEIYILFRFLWSGATELYSIILEFLKHKNSYKYGLVSYLFSGWENPNTYFTTKTRPLSFPHFPSCMPSKTWFILPFSHNQFLIVTHFRYLFFSFSEATRGSAVKRFSISFARHPTNGMFAFVKIHPCLIPSDFCLDRISSPPPYQAHGMWPWTLGAKCSCNSQKPCVAFVLLKRTQPSRTGVKSLV